MEQTPKELVFNFLLYEEGSEKKRGEYYIYYIGGMNAIIGEVTLEEVFQIIIGILCAVALVAIIIYQFA